MFDDEGALLVEDQQGGLLLDEVGDLAGEGSADLESDLPGDDGPLSRILVTRTPSNDGAGRCGTGRGGSAFGVASQACCGVIRPGSP